MMQENADTAATPLVPVLFDIYLDTGEATGIIYWFCSSVCREQSEATPCRGDVLKPEDDVELGCEEYVCETCGRILDPEFAAVLADEEAALIDGGEA